MIQLPQIDLSTLAPIAGLAAIAVVCIAALLLRSLLRSRIAALIAIVAGVLLAGPTLAAALSGIVMSLVPLLLVVVAGLIGALFLLGRNPELMDLVRDVVPKRASINPNPPMLEQGQPPVIINQFPAPQATMQHTTVRRNAAVNSDLDTWGFS